MENHWLLQRYAMHRQREVRRQLVEQRLGRAETPGIQEERHDRPNWLARLADWLKWDRGYAATSKEAAHG
jgi:hypothetical protein